jgi:hypothetical protein
MRNGAGPRLPTPTRRRVARITFVVESGEEERKKVASV